MIHFLLTAAHIGRKKVERADWSVRTETYAEMWSDYDTYFYLKASLLAFS